MGENVDYSAYIAPHIQDNYRQITAERHDGDWRRLARELDAAGETTLARWAASQADAPVDGETADDKTPTRATRRKS